MSIRISEHGIGVVKQMPDGRICQVGLTESQYYIVCALLESFSQDEPLTLLPPDYDLMLKSEVSA